ncbi:protein translocase subunit SecF [Candidatus Woesearchaeota archaeon]|nr:protein translocase subunit SecF [Candidatus Woesearchaeota archaeon]
MSRRERKLLRRQGKKYRPDSTVDADHGNAPGAQAARADTAAHHEKRKKSNPALEFYENNYKKLMWVTIALLIISFMIIGAHTVLKGEIMPRGVTLKGGVTITVPYESELDTDGLQSYLRGEFPQASINVRAMSSAGSTIGFIVDASDVDPEELLDSLETQTGKLEKFSIETMGSSLGEAFFRQTMLAVLIAFILMSIVVFFSFKTFVPSFAVILSAVSDIAMTVAVVDLFGIRIETAGIAALLMLIGYSVDTDVLLTTRVIKREEGTVFDRVMGAMKTGMTMTVTSIAAISVALIFTQSETLRQIMLILLIGLIFDILNTWIQNAGILRMYMEHKSKKKAAAVLADYQREERHSKVHDAVYEEVEKEIEEEDRHHVKKSHEHHAAHRPAEHHPAEHHHAAHKPEAHRPAEHKQHHHEEAPHKEHTHDTHEEHHHKEHHEERNKHGEHRK